MAPELIEVRADQLLLGDDLGEGRYVLWLDWGGNDPTDVRVTSGGIDHDPERMPPAIHWWRGVTVEYHRWHAWVPIVRGMPMPCGCEHPTAESPIKTGPPDYDRSMVWRQRHGLLDLGYAPDPA